MKRSGGSGGGGGGGWMGITGAGLRFHKSGPNCKHVLRIVLLALVILGPPAWWFGIPHYDRYVTQGEIPNDDSYHHLPVWQGIAISSSPPNLVSVLCNHQSKCRECGALFHNRSELNTSPPLTQSWYSSPTTHVTISVWF